MTDKKTVKRQIERQTGRQTKYEQNTDMVTNNKTGKRQPEGQTRGETADRHDDQPLCRHVRTDKYTRKAGQHGGRKWLPGRRSLTLPLSVAAIASIS